MPPDNPVEPSLNRQQISHPEPSGPRFNHIEQLPLTVYIVDLGGNRGPSYISPQIQKLLGYQPSEWIASPDLWKRLVHPDDLPRVIKALRSSQQSGEAFEAEYRMFKREGKLIWVRDMAYAMPVAPGATPRLLGAVADITESRRIQSELIKSETRYRELVETMNDGVAVFQVVGDGEAFLFKDFNRAAEHITGLPKDQIIGLSVDHCCPRFAAMGLRDALKTAWSSGKSIQLPGGRYAAPHADLWLDSHVFKLPSGELVCIFEDVTEKTMTQTALRDADERLRRAQSYANIGYWELPKGGAKAICSDEALRLLRLEDRSASGPEVLREAIIPNSFQHIVDSLRDSLRDGTEHHLDFPIVRPDGKERWMECRAKPIWNKDGVIDKLSGIIQDITERKHIEQALRASEARFKAVATTTNDLVYEWDILTGQVEWWGDIDQALGYSPERFPRTYEAWLNAIHPKDRERVDNRVKRITDAGAEVNVQYRIKTADGEWRVWNDKGRTLTQNQGERTVVIGGCADITAQHKAEEEIQHLAFHDSLTGLPNRILFKEELKQALARYLRNNQQFALHFLDLDHFKDVNDSLGHPIGDELLQMVAHRIRNEVRHSDFFARLGGDEFALIQYNVKDNSEASILAEKVIAAIKGDFTIQENLVRTNTSIGIIVPERNQFDVNDLMSRADVALYKAKGSGRGTYSFFEDSMTLQLQNEMELIQKLGSALINGEFFLEYQPQIELRSGKLVGLEALIRWHHPQRGLLLPTEFLPIAEKRGMIQEISDWVLKTACRQAKTWMEEGFEFGRIAINLCANQVTNSNFLHHMLGLIDEFNIPPDVLELEFTETVLMDASPEMQSTIQQLSQAGFTFAIDDFGTGFSSLIYLKKFHTDKIKIDRAFIQDLLVDPSDAEIVKAAIALGSALGLATIAEGVETRSQVNFLLDNGCDHAQGLLFGGSQSAQDIRAKFSPAD
ncbi:MAG: EAL domain-containing protein [Gammaproteobacteria bacterium]|nr:EAL domain-containing protein [Gammaproteobacteria bacterium]